MIATHASPVADDKGNANNDNMGIPRDEPGVADEGIGAPPDKIIIPDPEEKFSIFWPIFNFATAPAPTVASPPPAPFPQTVVIPPSYTLSVVSPETPLNLIVSPPATQIGLPGGK